MKVSAEDKAAALLGIRPHFRRELAQKLAAREYESEEIEAALDHLASLGYLDDERTAREFVAARQARKSEGFLRLKLELERRGAPPEAVAAALAELPDDDLAPCQDAAEAWRRAHPKGNVASLARHLARKGFRQRSIVEVCRSLDAAGGAELDLED